MFKINICLKLNKDLGKNIFKLDFKIKLHSS